MRINKPATRVVLAAALWLAVLGWIDRATGYEIGLFPFYTAPVGLVAWYLGQRPAILTAFIASVIWFAADSCAGDRYSSSFYAYWNAGMHFTTFLINAIAFAKIKSSLDRRHQLERDLAESRAEVRRLTGLLPACPQCGKPHLPKAAGPAQGAPAQTPALCEACRPR